MIIQPVSQLFLRIGWGLGQWFQVGWDSCSCVKGFCEWHGLLSLERAWECSHSYVESIFPRVKICGRKRHCPDIEHLGDSFPSPATPTARKYFLRFSLSSSCFSVSSFPLALSKTETGNSCSPSIGSCSWGSWLQPSPKSSLLQNKQSNSKKHSLRLTQTTVSNYFLSAFFNPNTDPRYHLSLYSTLNSAH